MCQTGHCGHPVLGMGLVVWGGQGSATGNAGGRWRFPGEGVGKVPGTVARGQRGGSSVGGSVVAKATGSMWSCQLFSVHSGQPTPVSPAMPCPLASPTPPLPCLPPSCPPTVAPSAPFPPCQGSHGAGSCGTTGSRVFRAPDPSVTTARFHLGMRRAASPPPHLHCATSPLHPLLHLLPSPALLWGPRGL